MKLNGETINSQNTLKILGFNFDDNAGAYAHVQSIERGYGKRIWVLRNLKKSGMYKKDLVTVYKTILRPFIEYCSVVYNSMLNNQLCARLENLQKRSIKSIFGWNCDYKSVCEEYAIEKLADRRALQVDKFIKKCYTNLTLRNRWFHENEKRRSNRLANQIQIPKTRTRRAEENPLLSYRKRLNTMLKER